MRGRCADERQVTGYQNYDEIFGLLKSGEVDEFALSGGPANAMAKKDLPGERAC